MEDIHGNLTIDSSYRRVLEDEDTSEEGAGASEVKSTAVVKFSQVEMPALFQQLTPNTNLNKPPSNWLYGNSKWESYIQNVSMGKEHSFSSFKMAHTYPDLTGEIDVVTDSEILKKLLKIPYSKAPVSMMVHRVGNTLLLDEFDVHRHLLRKQADDWKWLRKFYYDTVLENVPTKDKQCVLKKNKSRHHLQQQNMFSKFLYYSMKESNEEDQADDSNNVLRTADNSLESFVQDAQNLPDPLPKPNQMDYQRTVVWNFEDLRMLIGTDLPIFGGGTHPCVSLRLQDMKKPISVLTGLDYWLDNLMCNVPELAMCYHLQGIVQSYELIKTEEIPNITDSEFAPQVVKDIAQNILSFLKSKATKEGHTYWLFKGKDDDVVKLYDLTTLCSDSDVDDGEDSNPFTVPVAILYYRVARNMRQRLGKKRSGIIRTLLSKCLSLLDKDIYPQIVTSAHYLLSDLYVSDDIYNQEMSSESSEESDDNDCDDVLVDEGSGPSSSLDTETVGSLSTVEVKALCYPDSVDKPSQEKDVVRYPSVSGSVNKRSHDAIRHIADGLMCLDMSVSAEKSEPQSSSEKHVVETQRECNPFEPIPLHYEPLQKRESNSKQHREDVSSYKQNLDDSTDISDSEDEDRSQSSRSKEVSVFSPQSFLPSGTWHTLSKALLLRKAAISFYALAQTEIKDQKYGVALKYTKLALHSFCAMEKLRPDKATENYHVLSAILGVSGDLHMMLSREQSTDPFKQGYEQYGEDEGIIIQSIHRELPDLEHDWVLDISSNLNVCFENAQNCYDKALDYASKGKANIEFLNTIYKRMGNVFNETGVYYMNRSSKIASGASEEPKNFDLIQSLWQKSEACFLTGISHFAKFDDKLNMALVWSNLGRLMRLCASTFKDVCAGKSQTECTLSERKYLKKSQQHYLEAMQLLKTRETHPEIWDSVQWELSSAFFSMAIMLQDNAPLSTMAQEHVEKEITDMMIRSLKYCDTRTAGPKLPHCQYRAATIHHRLASLNHNGYRNQLDEQKKKQFREMAELHYCKAYDMFSLLETPCEVLRIQLERVALCEYQLGNLTSNVSKNKVLSRALGYVKICDIALPFIISHIEDASKDGSDVDSNDFNAEAKKLLSILESRLHFVLLQLVRNNSTPKHAKDKKDVSSKYKAMYASVLKLSTASKDISVIEKCIALKNCLNQVTP